MPPSHRSVHELAQQLLADAAPERLDAPLDVLARSAAEEPFAEQLLAAHGEGVAHTLRELLEDDRLDRWVAETCTAREEQSIAQGLEGWLGRHGAGDDDPESWVTVPEPPDEPAGLARWAAQHGVADLLDQPLEQCLPSLAAAPGTPLREACTGRAETAATSLLERGSLARDARAGLAGLAASRAAVAERARLWSGSLPEGSLGTLAARLKALLADTSPEALGAYRFVPAHPVHVNSDTAIADARLHAPASGDVVSVRLWLSGYEHAGVTGTCRACGDQPGCAHQRALAARLLDAVLRPQDRLHPALAVLAAEPSWRRFVRALEEPGGGEPSAQATAPARLCFRLRAGRTLQVGVFLQKRSRQGVWSLGRQVVPQKRLRSGGHDAVDQPALEAMQRLQRSFAPGFVKADVSLLRALLEHPNVQIEAPDGTLQGPIRVLEQRLRLEFRRGPHGLVPCAFLAEHPVASSPEGGPADHLHGYDAGTRSLVFAPLTPALRRLLAALASFRGALPPESFASLAPRLARLRGVADVRAPDALRGSERTVPRKLLMRIVASFDEGIEVAVSMRPLPLGALWSPGVGPEIVHGLQDGEAVFARRDLDWERRTAKSVQETLALDEHMRLEPFRFRVEGNQAALEVLSRAARLSECLELEWAERTRPLRIAASFTRADLKVRLFKRGAWLQMEGAAHDEETRVSVQRLLEAARRGERFVAIEGGDYAEIERELFERLERTQLCILDPKLARLTLSPASLPFALEQLGEAGEVEAEARAWLAAATGARRAEPWLQWADVLRDYQLEGLRWLLSRSEWAPGACLADEMGLGKTVQAIALLAERASLGAALVVAPTSVTPGWQAELTRFAPALTMRMLDSAASWQGLEPPAAGEVWVTSYDRLLRQGDAVAEHRFATQVIDEAQLIKNASTRRARIVRSVRADFRLALTGTPVENRLGDLWSLFHLIAPGLLGSWQRFRAVFAVPIERYQDAERAGDLRRLVAPLLLRRRKQEVAQQLPSKSEVVQLVELSPAERELYDTSLERARRRLRKREGGTALTMITELTRLRQLACHPRLVLDDPAAESSKLRALLQLLDDLLPRGHRALLFSQFTSHLALVREALEARRLSYLYLDGSTSGSERARRVQRFQRGESQLFLISLKAGGTGLNLTGADYVIHLDPWWNPTAEDQASDRAHRIGQQRPVTVIKLVSEGTIEERVLALHTHKRELADAVIGGESSTGPLDRETLDALLEVAG